MTQIRAQIEYTLPAWAIQYLEYGETEGLNDDELSALERELNGIEDYYPLCHYTWSYKGEPYFSHTNDLDRMGGDVVDATLTVFER